MWWFALAVGCRQDPETSTTPPTTSTEATCDDGLPVASFQQGPYGTGLHALADDVALDLRDGTRYVRSERWDGCESLLFVPSRPTQEGGNPFALWSRDLEELLRALPRHTRLFFVSNAPSDGEAEAELAQLDTDLAAAFDALGANKREQLDGRVHIVAGRAGSLGSWVDAPLTDPGFGFGIDRTQHIRWIGSFADGARYDGSMGWFQSNVSFAANEAVAWDAEAQRDHLVAGWAATRVRAFDGLLIEDPGWTGAHTTAVIDVPSDLERYDALDLELTLDCVGEGEVGECPAWDYLVYARLCEGEDDASCPTELGRWITTYHREGRWLVDASHLLPLLHAGERRAITFESIQPYEVTLDLLFHDDEDEALRPLAVTPLFTGGGLNPTYNDAHPPVTVEVPAGAERVELVVLVTGHGGEAPWNCAEFCVTDHHFGVGGADHAISLSDAGSATGCQEQIADGTVPNQYGTWFYGRSNWCPGKQVDPIRVDVTSDVTPGSSVEVTYEALFRGDDYQGSAANIVLSSWLVSWGS
ncbi:MAG: hypothetical protein H6738_13195 [Alphaproteobacteria bacterium]|nr:hypothetical protein [Alphaproteobacteria bacterium]MCB9697732.1 hypothetical protein [Alphaproteobacteria bacterium]